MEKDIDEIIAYHHELGTPFIGCSYSPTETKEELERLERVMKTAQKKAAPYGIKVVYHNHAHEFKPLDDVRPIDEIAKWCLLEPDTYWVFHAGDNPCEFLRRYRTRVGLIHLKDGVDGKGTSIGDGANDLKSLWRPPWISEWSGSLQKLKMKTRTLSLSGMPKTALPI